MLLLVPAFTPFTFHWYDGVEPAFIGMAVKVTVSPEQAGLTEALIVMLTGRGGLTDSWMMFEVAGLPVGQDELDVRMQDTRSPFTGV